uniref:Transposase n=1 Tax=Prevotella sp. GTC17262 TaxID=3236797 RepID=A0AB33JJW1_9BACT
METRHSKTAAQQCRFYEVENIFVYMVETYINGNHSNLRTLYKELRRDARKDFIDFLFETMETQDTKKIIQTII